MDGPFRYAGVENGDACYCGNADDKFIPTDPKECNIPCTGDPSQFCGSSWRMQVYDTEKTKSGIDLEGLLETYSGGSNITVSPEDHWNKYNCFIPNRLEQI